MSFKLYAVVTGRAPCACQSRFTRAVSTDAAEQVSNDTASCNTQLMTSLRIVGVFMRHDRLMDFNFQPLGDTASTPIRR
jgi:hypothetical protein